ncbi:MAG: response regulator [bacterium]|nr:response regulator [bacterium]
MMDKGNIQSTSSICSDSDLALRRAQVYHQILSNMPSGLFIYQFEEPSKLTLVGGNHEAEKLTGIDIEKITGSDFLDIWPQAGQNGLTDSLLEVVKTGRSFESENVFYKDNSIEGSYKIRAFCLPGDRLAVSFLDVSDYRKALNKLHDSEEMFRLISEQSVLGILVLQDDMFRYVNQKAADIFGYTIDEMKEWRVREYAKLIHPDDMELVIEQARKKQLNEKDYTENYQWRAINKRGEIRWVETYSRPVPFNGGICDVVTIIDVTERKLAEEAKYISERKLELQNRIANIFLTAADDRMYDLVLSEILKIMESKYGLFGYFSENNDLICPSMTEEIWNVCNMKEKELAFTKSNWRENIWGKAILNKKGSFLNSVFAVPAGHVEVTRVLCMPIIFMENPIGVIVVANKKTDYNNDDLGLIDHLAGQIAPVLNARLERDRQEKEKKKLEEQFFQSQKMETIGRLAGGIAHDFNNILTSLMGYADMLKMKHPEPDNMEGVAIDHILRGTVRAAELTKQLLGFARKGNFNPKPLNINYMIRDCVNVLENIFEKKIKVVFNLSPNIKAIEGDKSQIDQVISNIIINANDAMPNGGKLSFKTLNINYKKPSSKWPQERKNGDYVQLSISDTGSGINKEVRDHIFEPFFTTKSEGEGTGLGLATVFGIVKNHNGYIDCESEMEHGTTFNIYFPVTDLPVKESFTKNKVLKGHGTILVVDDEENIRDSIGEILKSLGYKAISAKNGIEAINIFRKKHPKIDLVLLDMIMPKMNGRDTFYELKNIKSDVKVLLSSGYSKSEIIKELLSKGAAGFLQKPYEIEKLSREINKLIMDF